MNTTYYRTKGVIHTVNAGEAGSGLVVLGYDPVSAGENPTNELMSIVQVTTSAGVTKSGFSKVYDKNSGILTLANEGSFSFVTNDIVELFGCWYV